jgi:tetratricopeptide (TPR) repeat protein
MKRDRNKLYAISICMALALTTIIAYEPVRHNGFVGFDDVVYVAGNPHVKEGITREAVVWAFTTPHSGNWHSLTWLSHILDCQFFGLNALGHHLTSLFFHLANTLLLFLALKRMTGAVWPSAFVAAAFALHPLHVESVAWVSERKDVLSGFFWMLTMTAYVRYAERPGIRRYLLVVLAFCLGLLSKSMLVTLPFVLLLLDYWPLGRIRSRKGWPSPLSQPKKGKAFSKSKPAEGDYQSVPAWRLIREKIPLFALAAVSSVITFVVQQRAGAMAMELSEKLPLNFRISNALVSYISYIGKMIYPSRLAVFYPLNMIPPWRATVCFVMLAAISAFIIVSHRRYLMVGWLWYLGTLVPVIGLVQVGSQAIADRYTYLPSIGIFIMVAWGAAEVGTKRHFRRLWLGISTGLVLAILLICTRMQVRYWQDNLTLYKRAAEVTENNFRMHTLYGNALLLQRGEIDEAITHFKEALRINPLYSKANKGLGKALLVQGNFDEAVRCFNAALLTEKNLFGEKDLPDVYGNLGLAYVRLGKDGPAVTNLIKSIELDPNSADNLNNLAWVLATTEDAKLHNPTDAIKYAQRACELSGYEQPSLLDTLAVAYAAAGNFPEAVKTAEKAIKSAEDTNDKKLAEEIQKRLELYKAGQPYHQK